MNDYAAASGFQPLKQAEINKESSLHSAHTENYVALLEHQINQKISGFLPVSQLNTTDFTPTAVANRILDFVEIAVKQKAGNELEAQSLLRQAKEGIAQGVMEARERLSGMSQMTEKIESQIDETVSLIFQGLDDLAKEPFNTSSYQQTGKLISETRSISGQFKQSDQALIEIVTQDGDKVKVSYSAFTQSVSHQHYSNNSQGTDLSSEYSASSSSTFQFSVQGVLDDEEKQAINELLNRVGELANQFFNGDVQSAFNSAMQLGFDSKALKSLALDFQQSTYVQEMQTYQRTESMSDPLVSTIEGPAAYGPALAVDVLSQLEQLIELAKENAAIEEPEKMIKSLLMDILNQEFDLPMQGYIKDSIESI